MVTVQIGAQSNATTPSGKRSQAKEPVMDKDIKSIGNNSYKVSFADRITRPMTSRQLAKPGLKDIKLYYDMLDFVFKSDDKERLNEQTVSVHNDDNNSDIEDESCPKDDMIPFHLSNPLNDSNGIVDNNHNEDTNLIIDNSNNSNNEDQIPPMTQLQAKIKSNCKKNKHINPSKENNNKNKVKTDVDEYKQKLNDITEKINKLANYYATYTMSSGDDLIKWTVTHDCINLQNIPSCNIDFLGIKDVNPSHPTPLLKYSFICCLNMENGGDI